MYIAATATPPIPYDWASSVMYVAAAATAPPPPSGHGCAEHSTGAPAGLGPPRMPGSPCAQAEAHYVCQGDIMDGLCVREGGASVQVGRGVASSVTHGTPPA